MRVHTLLMLAIIAVFTVSCKKDELPEQKLISVQERNRIDDQAIEIYLKEHYFNADGKSLKFGTLPDDENNTPLFDLAQKDPSGFWYVKNPNVEAIGAKVTNNNADEISLQYDMEYFTAYENDKKRISFTPYTLLSTINTTGTPEDPVFFYGKGQKFDRKYYEIKGFIDGIKYFNATNRAINALPAVNFQGLIIIPSRLVFGRNPNKLSQAIDFCIIVNFELYKVSPRKEK